MVTFTGILQFSPSVRTTVETSTRPRLVTTYTEEDLSSCGEGLRSWWKSSKDVIGLQEMICPMKVTKCL